MIEQSYRDIRHNIFRVAKSVEYTRRERIDIPLRRSIRFYVGSRQNDRVERNV